MASLPRASALWPGAVAVSGGGDSVALMVLLATWAKEQRVPPPIVLTVDHGLRRTSRAEAQAVVRAANRLGLQAHILVWKGPRPRADIEAAAREARYRIMGEWCRAHAVPALYVAHSLDDQAETFLLRLARGSGVDGLSAMRAVSSYPVRGIEGVMLVRPLLGFGRTELRATLEAQGLKWLEDPMNSDPRFARSRLRAAWPALQKAGLSAARIGDAARHMRRARDALDWATGTFLAAGCRFEDGAAALDGELLAAAPREIGLRALARIVMAVSGAVYRPRFERLERLYDAIVRGQLGAGATLLGCKVAPAPKRRTVFGGRTLWIAPERPRRLRNAQAGPKQAPAR